LAAVCHACVVSDGSAAMLWTAEGGVYGMCDLNCSKSCRTAGGRTNSRSELTRTQVCAQWLQDTKQFYYVRHLHCGKWQNNSPSVYFSHTPPTILAQWNV